MKGPAPSKPNASKRATRPGEGKGAGAGTQTGPQAGAGAGAGEGEGAGASTASTVDTVGPGTGEFWQDPKPGAGAGAGETTGAGAGAETKRGPGRPKGSGTGTQTKKEKISASVEGIEGILLSLHTIAATLTKVPEFQLSEPEAKQMATAIQRVSIHYNFMVDEKTLALWNLAGVTGSIYGTRFWSYHLRKQAEVETKKRDAQREANTRPFPSPFAVPNPNAAGAAL